MKEQSQPYHDIDLQKEEAALHEQWDRVDEMRECGNIQGARQILGMSESDNWTDIYEVLGERERRIWASRLCLPQDTPGEVIDDILFERKRVEFVTELQLPTDTTWETLNEIWLARWHYRKMNERL